MNARLEDYTGFKKINAFAEADAVKRPRLLFICRIDRRNVKDNLYSFQVLNGSF